MDGRGRVYDNIGVERLWRSVKYETVYVHDWQQVKEARTGLEEDFTCYNHERPHQSLDDKPPAEVYFGLS
jgi:putative transposase